LTLGVFHFADRDGSTKDAWQLDKDKKANGRWRLGFLESSLQQLCWSIYVVSVVAFLAVSCLLFPHLKDKFFYLVWSVTGLDYQSDRSPYRLKQLITRAFQPSEGHSAWSRLRNRRELCSLLEALWENLSDYIAVEPNACLTHALQKEIDAFRTATQGKIRVDLQITGVLEDYKAEDGGADLDVVVCTCTLVLCSVDEPAKMLLQIYDRLVIPGGKLVTIEHSGESCDWSCAYRMIVSLRLSFW
jgi:hypothetical protein